MNKLIPCLLAFFVTMITSQAATLNRIKVKSINGRSAFYDSVTNEPFIPLGISHTNGPDLPAYDFAKHSLFTEAHYVKSEWESVLNDLERFGYNTIRVFHSRDSGTDNGHGGVFPVGFGGDQYNASGIDSDYMENFIEFVRLAGDRGIYVVHVINNFPYTSYYNNSVSSYPADTNFEGRNSVWGDQKQIDQRAAAWSKVMQYINDNAPDILPNLLCHLIAGEIRAVSNLAPFTQNSGSIVGVTGDSYDFGLDGRRQKLYNESVDYWADSVGAAIKAVDDKALVGVTLGLYQGDVGQSVGLFEPNGIQVASDYWNKHPILPWVMTNSTSPNVDVVDMHFYPWRGESIDVNLDASEFAACNTDNGKVIVAFEFGAAKHDPAYYSQAVSYSGVHPNVAAKELFDYREAILNKGFKGALFFAYQDLGLSHEVLLATESYSEILSKLDPNLRKWQLNSPEFQDNFDDGDLVGWRANGTWTTQSDAKNIKQSNDDATYYATVKNRSFTDFDYVVDMTLLAHHGWSGVQFRKNAETDSPFTSGYTAYLNANGDVGLYKPGVNIVDPLVASGFDPVVGTQLTLRVRTRGTNIRVYVNNVERINVNDSAYSSGSVGLVTSKTQATFDNVKVDAVTVVN
ncbi:family 16 glycoside hydrolase [Coraliomargarita sp. W4R72]